MGTVAQGVVFEVIILVPMLDQFLRQLNLAVGITAVAGRQLQIDVVADLNVLFYLEVISAFPL